jgi:hypothetical protein
VASADPNELAYKVANVYLKSSLQAESGGTGNSSPDASRFAGTYFDSRRHFVYSFSAAEGNLRAWGANLRHLGPDQFRDLGTGTISFDNSGGAMKATLEMDGETFFAGTRAAPPRLTAAELAAYAGSYRSAELDATYNLGVQDGSLVLRSWDPPLKLMPVAPDVFNSDDLGTLMFHRDAGQRVSGLSLTSVNARNIRFDKLP